MLSGAYTTQNLILYSIKREKTKVLAPGNLGRYSIKVFLESSSCVFSLILALFRTNVFFVFQHPIKACS